MMSNATFEPVEILLVEDNPGDVRLTKEALRHSKVLNSIHIVGDGDSALEFLKRTGEFAEAPPVDLVLLDLNLPGLHGRDVLSEIRREPRLTHLPVVILTTSSAEIDILKSYKLHANCYITKPLDFDGFTEVVRALEGFWLSIVKLPPRAVE